ncbi:MAG: long-chain fatty acid--CoA ligase [Dehalococcoidia bacterium]
MWLPSIAFESASRFRDRCAFVFNDRRLTYGEFGSAIEAVAAGLQHRHIGHGVRVALMLENCVEFVVAYYAILATGASVVSVNALLARPELQHVLTDSSSALLISGGRIWDTARAGAAGSGVECVQVDDLASTQPFLRAAPAPGDSEAVVMYTSGTTGKPKGAVLTHDNLLMNAWVCASQSMFNLTPDDAILCCLPIFHASGQTCLVNAGLLAGATVVLMRQFVAADVLATMRREGVTFFLGVPTMYVGLLEQARSNPDQLPRLRMVVSGGAAMPLAVLREFERVFNVSIYEGYGLTETAPTACFNQPHFPRRPGTIGKAIWGIDVEIAASDVESRIVMLPRGQVGEVIIRGHNVFAGYLNQPQATALCLVDGWFRTGDIGIKDDEGYLKIVDRKKDMIVRGGFNIYPREVEEVLMTHPAVSMAAVVGRPDDVFGEEVVAVLRLSATSGPVTEDEIIAWSRERLAKYKYPREVMFVAEMPVGAGGKILKREIAQLVRSSGVQHT